MPVDYRLSNGKTIRGVDEKFNPQTVLSTAREDFGDPSLEFVFENKQTGKTERAPNPALARSETQYEVEAPSALARIGAGASDVFSGARQVAGEIMPNTMRAITGQSPEEFTRQKTEERGQYEKSRKASGNEGIDWLRIAGNVAGGAPVALLGAPEALAARTLQGTGIGGALGYSTFVPGDAEGKTGPRDRLINTALGATFGGATPGLFDLSKYLAKGAYAGTVGTGRAAANRALAEPARKQADEVWSQAAQIARQRGVEVPEKMPIEMRRSLEAQGQKAASAGGLLDPEALARRLEMEAHGYSPRTAQLTRDPKAFAEELNLMKRSTPGGEKLRASQEAQSRKMAADLEAVANRFGPQAEGTTGEKAMRAMDTIESEWRKSGEEVSKAYQAIRAERGDLPVPMERTITEISDIASTEGGKTAMGDMAEIAMNRLRKYGLIDRDGNIKPDANLTLTQMEDFRKAISRTDGIKGATVPENMRAKRIIVNLIDDATENSPAGDLFAPARAQARERFQLFSGKALDAVLAGKAEPEQFFRRFVLNSPVSDLKKTLTALETAGDEGAATSNMLRRELADHILERAGGPNAVDGLVSAPGLRRAIREVGEDKVKQILGDRSYNDLIRLRRFAEDLFTEPNLPGGSLANRSGTAAEVESILQPFGQGGVSGEAMRFGKRALESASDERAAQAALSGGVMRAQPQGADLLQQTLSTGRSAYDIWANSRKRGVQDLLLQLEKVPSFTGRASSQAPAQLPNEYMRTR